MSRASMSVLFLTHGAVEAVLGRDATREHVVDQRAANEHHPDFLSLRAVRLGDFTREPTQPQTLIHCCPQDRLPGCTCILVSLVAERKMFAHAVL